MSFRHRAMLFLLVVAGCSSTPVTPPAPDGASDVLEDVSDVSAADVAVADVPVADVPVADVPVADVPVADVPVADVPAVDVLDARDVSVVDAPMMNDVGPRDGGMDASIGCMGMAPLCAMGTVGGVCGDIVESATCVERRWTCARGWIPLSECRCVGRPAPGCTCGATGWVCEDAGARDSGAVGCTGTAPSCVSGTPGGICSDALTVATCVRGTWTCMDDMILTSLCRCIGRPPGRDCVCGATGWVCGGADAGALVNCNPADVRCRSKPPVCTGGGEVPSVEGTCWGPCVVYTRCQPIACDPTATISQCPRNMVCYRTTRMCGPFL